jgi:hypothetical protein
MSGLNSNPSDAQSGLDALGPRYVDVFQRAREVFSSDDRVRGMWLHGAVARQAADAASDLDIDIAVADEGFDAFAEAWRDWLAAITPTVSAIPLGPGSFYALTPTCARLDVISERVSELATSTLTRRITVFDLDNLTGRVPPINDPPPNTKTIDYLIRETLRQAANFETVTVRDDWLLGVVAVTSVHGMLYQLFAESNKPQPATGPKQWSIKLAPRHRALLQQLPVPQPNRDSVFAARQAALGAFLVEAPAIAARYGVAWPTDLADAVLDYLAAKGIGVT